MGAMYRFGLHDEANAQLSVSEEGRVVLTSASSALGQGFGMTMALILSEEFAGLSLDQIDITLTDTALGPDGGITAASRQTTMTGRATYLAAQSLKSKLRIIASELLDVHPERLQWKEGRLVDVEATDRSVSLRELSEEALRTGINLTVQEKFVAPQTTPLNEETGQGGTPINSFSYTTTIADVQVDTETGEVQVLKLTSIHDSGTIINLEGAEAQVEGGLVMGLGMALTEDFKQQGSNLLVHGFTEYAIPTARDCPEIEVHFVQNAPGFGPYGTKGLAEAPTVAAAPAILNAIYDATGVRICNLPATPERIVRALREQQPSLQEA
jgi:CO/xanthine dehydrogenase Mo-binding subunit